MLNALATIAIPIVILFLIILSHKPPASRAEPLALSKERKFWYMFATNGKTEKPL